jgi:GNAT superfamily N-acetyltransferase
MTTSTDTTAPRRARADERAAVAAAMGEAFFDDPVMRWATPDDERRRSGLPAFFGLVADALAAHDQTWCTGDGVRGAAFVVPAFSEPMSDAEGEAFAARCAELAGPFADRWLEIIALLDDNHPHDVEHDYLWFLGVRPQWQGSGHGSTLLRALLDRADRSGTPVYLEATSPENRRLYLRHGFRDVGELTLAGAPPLWAMWREAGAKPAG